MEGVTTNDAPRGDAPGTPPKPSETTTFYESLTQTADYYDAPDRMLQTLVDSADVGGTALGVPITLFLQGSTIAGRIASSQAFYRAMAHQLREDAAGTHGGTVPEHVEEFARSTVEAVSDRISRAIDADEREFRVHGTTTSRWILSRHIYLEDTVHTLPGAAPIARANACVRLNQIVGWTLGIAD
jgi:hypothetical protein